MEASNSSIRAAAFRRRFADRKFVTEIVTIPDYYLRTSRGFGGLQGVQRLYSVDVVALVSHDQITHMDENEWSLGYLTILGAYVLKGSHHDVATLVDLAVVDPVTQSLILRAGGTDSRNRNTTLIDEERAARESGAASFGSATTQIRVARRESNARAGGGGSFGPLALGILLILLAARRRPRRAGISPRSSRIHCFSHCAVPRQPLTFLHITRQRPIVR